MFPERPAAAGRRPGRATINLIGLIVLVLVVLAFVAFDRLRSDEVEPALVATSTTASVPEPSAPTDTPATGSTTDGSTTTVADGEPDTDTESSAADTESTIEPPAARMYAGHYEPTVVATHPHDGTAFTQGLEWRGDQLVETTGLRGESTVRLVDPTTGTVEASVALSDALFGEGATVVDGNLVQVTWTSETLLIHDLDELAAIATGAGDPATVTATEAGAYGGEGWGLCLLDERLVMSNGSSELTFRNPATFGELGRLAVTLNGEPVEELNELECAEGLVWANVWKTSTIVGINPATGDVVATVDAAALVPEVVGDPADDVLNGIAHNPDTGRYWLTGKRWATMYEVVFEPVPSP
ncbi:MAG: glutaminyl-peptide cyclotransferase [Actinomycetota bacterium]